MLTKAKALYQVKLILGYLPKEEYDLISNETINYIEENYEYDENIIINPDVPLDEQEIDDKTYEFLDKIINESEKIKDLTKTDELEKYITNVKKENKEFNVEVENIKLKQIIETLEKENKKIYEAKELLLNYKEVLKQKEEEIERVKQDNAELYECIKKVPKFIRKIFMKEENKKLLK